MRHNIYAGFSLRVYTMHFNKPLNCSTNTCGKVSQIMKIFIVVTLRTIILQQRLRLSSLVLDIQTREMTCLIFKLVTCSTPEDHNQASSI